ncbi:hypothetical protein [Parashewanella tropica]|uniref:hypothetical protein n=1 Tax=Parashewanella tropica TaxID=2547970 RepID=UPI001059F023|nr:hypothetical protein [Parashewanella tropica]
MLSSLWYSIPPHYIYPQRLASTAEAKSERACNKVKPNAQLQAFHSQKNDRIPRCSTVNLSVQPSQEQLLTSWLETQELKYRAEFAPALSATERAARLFQQQAVSQIADALVIECTRINFEDLLTPSCSISPVVANSIDTQIATNVSKLCKQLQDTKYDDIPIEIKQQLIKIAESFSDIRKLIVPLSKIGEALLNTANQCKLTSLSTSDFGKVKSCPIISERSAWFNVLSPSMKRRVCRILIASESEVPDAFTEQELLNAIGTCTESDISIRALPIFVSSIPHSFANEWAKPYGFIDSLWSLNNFHGPLSHSLQLCLASMIAGANTETVQTLIDKDLWNLLLDNNFLKESQRVRVASDSKFVQFFSLPSTIFGTSPNTFQEKLSTGTFSRALETIANQENNSILLLELKKSLGIEELDAEILNSLVRNIRALEVAIAKQTAMVQKEVLAICPDFKKMLEDPCQLLHFDETDSTVNMAQRHFVRRNLAEGNHVWGYFFTSHYPRGKSMYNTAHVIEIHSEEDIKQCRSFVILPKESPRLASLPPHVLALNNQEI